MLFPLRSKLTIILELYLYQHLALVWYHEHTYILISTYILYERYLAPEGLNH